VLLSWPPARAGTPEDRTVALDASGSLRVGQEAPFFAAWTPDNRVVNLPVLKADTTVSGHVLSFFSTTCKPCRTGLRMIAESRDRLRDARIRVLLVAYISPSDGPEEEARVRPYLESLGLGSADVLLDRFGKVSGAFGVAQNGGKNVSLPRTAVLDATARVRAILGAEGVDFIDRIVESLEAK